MCVCGFIKLLQDTASLERAGFAVTGAEIQALGDDLEAEEGFADFHGRSLMCIAGRRQVRNLDLLIGFPKSLILLKNVNRAEMVVRKFKSMIENYKHINALTDEKTKKCQEVMNRHIALKTSNIQHDEIFKLNGYVHDDDKQVAVVEDHMEALLQTQVIEDIIGHQRNNKQTLAINRFKRSTHPSANPNEAPPCLFRSQFCIR